ncbi:MAG: tetratricopeptide repeat protein [Fibrobacteria bacterium]|nr:tetratricopeptide repeat protein [Fibrobacteria bacterium]
MSRKFITILILCCVPCFSMNSPFLAAKAIRSFQAGKPQEARQLLYKSLKKALINSREDWIAKAALNLAEIEIQSGYYSQARVLLNKIPDLEDNEIRTLMFWKRAKLCVREGQIDSALWLINKASQNNRKDYSFFHDLRIDELRIKLEKASGGTDINKIQDDIQALKKDLPGKITGAIFALEALAMMKENNYSGAAIAWQKAIDYYQTKKLLVPMGQSLHYAAMCAYTRGDIKTALVFNKRAIGVFSAMGMERPGMKIWLFSLFLSESPIEQEKLKNKIGMLLKSSPNFSAQKELKNFRKYIDLTPSESIADIFN